MRRLIGGREVMALTFFYAVAGVYLGLPRTLTREAGEAAWLSVILMVLFTVAVYAVMAKALLAFPDGGLVEALQRAFGPLAAFVVALLFFAIIIFKGALFTREFVGEITQTVLPLTPTAVLVFLSALVGGYASMVGLEGLGRAAWFAMPWVVGGTIVLCALSLEWGHLYNILPVLGTGPRAVVASGWHSAGMLADVVVVVLAFEVQPRRGILAAGIRGYAMAGLVALAVQLATGLDFDWVASVHEPYPLYQLARLIAYGRFFQRLESVFVFVWVLVAGFRISLDVYLASTVFSRAANLPHPQFVVPAVAAIVYSAAMVFPSWDAAYRLASSLEPKAWVLLLFTASSICIALGVYRLRGGSRPVAGGGSG